MSNIHENMVNKAKIMTGVQEIQLSIRSRDNCLFNCLEWQRKRRMQRSSRGDRKKQQLQHNRNWERSTKTLQQEQEQKNEGNTQKQENKLV